MKKLFIAIILILLLINSVSYNKKFTLLDYFSGEYKVYTSTEMDSSIDLGFCYMSVDKKVSDSVVGESIKISNFEPVSAMKTLKAKLIKTETLSNGTIVMYAYTNLIDDAVNVENKKVNLQIACAEDYCIVGWPLILGSF